MLVAPVGLASDRGFFVVRIGVPTSIIVATSIVWSIDVATYSVDFLQIRGYTYRMGRKRLPDDVRREKPLRIRLNDEERSLVDSAATALDETASEYARRVLLKNATGVMKKNG